MCIRIRNSHDVSGIKIRNYRAKLSMYANDSTLFLKNSENELRKVVEILEKFYRLSGLQIHMEKTQCVKIGINTNRPNMCGDLNLSWD